MQLDHPLYLLDWYQRTWWVPSGQLQTSCCGESLLRSHRRRRTAQTESQTEWRQHQPDQNRFLQAIKQIHFRGITSLNTGSQKAQLLSKHVDALHSYGQLGGMKGHRVGYLSSDAHMSDLPQTCRSTQLWHTYCSLNYIHFAPLPHLRPPH